MTTIQLVSLKRVLKKSKKREADLGSKYTHGICTSVG